ncbi:MAG: indolepyruvate ferredoxin oxidoreductase subunit alpha [Lachnospiraceae bacterium]|jgi:indolepyruvate ferredoxin oxidoreductase alpha subunit|nr:indolepyruvate ferredoxin oxidoreductase subunit alpha [Lachnospiraceae bacterium]MCI1727310.1 indolepyruvate ferredoxin oxidoreductase subunit alpha [Lachnospiraceae bacterium]
MGEILSGDEAVARGVWEAGCTVAAAYPGTPSTEILENVAKYKKDIYSQWACNEKVAVEIVIGASIGGVRSFAAMKHVGMNVAADPIFTAGMTGVNGGMVIVTADDPGCHSSQNEQDNRNYAPHAKLMMMEPSDSQECKDFTKDAFALSEKFDIPVIIRMTTRICHAKSIVSLGEREDFRPIPYERNFPKFAMLPANAVKRHAVVEPNLLKIEEWSNDCPYNVTERAADSKIGIITSGVSYQHAKEVFGDTASYLKIGVSYPLPRKLITEFASSVETLYVIEENDPYLETMVKSLGFTKAVGKEKITCQGELNAEIIREALTDAGPADVYKVETVKLPGRPPVLCAGCPHRGFFFTLHKNLDKFVAGGDIGCYALGGAPPLSAFDYTICMGAGFSTLIGMEKALKAQGDTRKPLGMVGDSTFFHSGMTGIVDIVAAESNVVACVLDNSITAMTGHQDNPGTPRNLMGDPSPVVDLVAIIRAAGVPDDHMRIVDPLDSEALQGAFDAGYAAKGPFVIVTKRPCAMIKEIARASANKFCRIDPDKCRGCKACMKIACPAIKFEDRHAEIFDPASCTACGLCMQQCRFGAIEKVGE